MREKKNFSLWVIIPRTPSPIEATWRNQREFVKENMAYFKLFDVLDYEFENGIVPAQEENVGPLTPQDMRSKG